jgi:fructokinase
MPNNPPLFIFGEVLFDHFPGGKRVLGGAPFNVAWHLQAFGLAPRMLTRIGNDDEGREITALMTDWGLRRENVQIDPHQPTGSVQVSFEDGEPYYEIVEISAYDFIAAETIKPQTLSGIFYHGTLAARHPVSRASLLSVINRHQGTRFVDVNLRAPWWSSDTLTPLLEGADWVKLNEHELQSLQPNGQTLESAMRAFSRRFSLDNLIVTRGERGALVLLRERDFLPITPTGHHEVVDTVGAGDAFASAVLLGMHKNWPLEQMLERAQQFASALVGCRGATVQDRHFYQNFIKEWQL